jgi:hypothetical protein
VPGAEPGDQARNLDPFGFEVVRTDARGEAVWVGRMVVDGDVYELARSAPLAEVDASLEARVRSDLEAAARLTLDRLEDAARPVFRKLRHGID